MRRSQNLKAFWWMINLLALNLPSVKVFSFRMHSHQASFEDETVEFVTLIENKEYVSGSVFVQQGINYLTVAHGDTVYIPCNFGGPDDLTSWSLDGQLIISINRSDTGTQQVSHGKHTIFQNGTLRVDAINADTGKRLYSCHVFNSSGTGLSDFVDLDVIHPPQVKVTVQNKTFVEGGSNKILCDITSGDGEILLSWKFNNKPLPHDVTQRNASLYGSVIGFSKLRFEHSGIYQCSGKNQVGQHSASVTFIVKVPAKWVFVPEERTALLGSETTWKFQALGYPAPVLTATIGWTGQQEIFKPEKYSINFTSPAVPVTLGELKIKSSQTGNISYTAFNGEKEIVAFTRLLAGVSPRIVEPSEQFVVVEEGATVLLNCTVDDRDGPLHVRWRKGSIHLESLRQHISSTYNSDKKELVVEQLILPNVTTNQAGNFTCSADSPFGSEKKIFILEVRTVSTQRPVILGTFLLNLVHVGGTSATFSWKRLLKGDSSLLYYELQILILEDGKWKSWHQVDIDKHLSRYTINDLPRGTKFRLSIAGYFENGRGDYSNPSIFVTTPTKPPGNSPVPGIIAMILAAVFIACVLSAWIQTRKTTGNEEEGGSTTTARNRLTKTLETTVASGGQRSHLEVSATNASAEVPQISSEILDGPASNIATMESSNFNKIPKITITEALEHETIPLAVTNVEEIQPHSSRHILYQKQQVGEMDNQQFVSLQKEDFAPLEKEQEKDLVETHPLSQEAEAVAEEAKEADAVGKEAKEVDAVADEDKE